MNFEQINTMKSKIEEMSAAVTAMLDEGIKHFDLNAVPKMFDDETINDAAENIASLSDVHMLLHTASVKLGEISTTKDTKAGANTCTRLVSEVVG